MPQAASVSATVTAAENMKAASRFVTVEWSGSAATQKALSSGAISQQATRHAKSWSKAPGLETITKGELGRFSLLLRPITVGQEI